METLCSALSRLSDSDVIKEVKRLAANERHATSDLVASIAVLDARRAYAAEGYTSTHAWCVKVLGFSDDAAFYRITAARVVQSYPEVLEMLRTGVLTLKAIRLLAPHLEEANHEELLAAAAHKSADEVAHLIAARKPRPDVPATIRKLPEPRGAQATANVAPGQEDALDVVRSAENGRPVAVATSASGSTVVLPVGYPGSSRAPGPATQSLSIAATTPGVPAVQQAATTGEDLGLGVNSVAGPATSGTQAGSCARPLVDGAARHRAVMEPLSPGRYKLEATITAETRAKIQHARDLLRHQVPDGDIGTVLDRALTALIEGLERNKAAIVRRPRSEAEPGARQGHEAMNVSASSTVKAVAGRRGDPAVAATEQAPSLKTMDRRAREDSIGPHGLAVDSSGRREAPPSRSRHIPAAVRRAVWRRDQGRCAYVGSLGRCSSTSRLEFHHIVPFAAGGEATVDNVALTCTVHNHHEAERFFGSDQERYRLAGTRTADDKKPTRSGTRKKLPSCG